MDHEKGIQNVVEDISIWFSTVMLTLLQIILLPYNLLAGALVVE